MDSDAGKRWRYLVLQHGSSRSEAETLENFLGRKLNSKAIFDEIAGGLEHQIGILRDPASKQTTAR